MGICNDVVLPKVEAIIENFAEPIRMIELGDQVLHKGGHSKAHYTKLGCDHVYIDMHGNNGSLPLDLRTKIEIEPADLITNHGTTEHVEGIEGQLVCFENIHNMCKVGGYMVHQLPVPGTWSGHCPHYYTLQFFELLAKNNNYKVLENRMLNEGKYTGSSAMIWCVLQKVEEGAFNPEDLELHIESV